MQDIHLIQPFQPEAVIKKLKDSPPDQKYLKEKIEKIYSLTSQREQEYLPDVRELYYWLVVFNRFQDFRDFIPGEKLQRFFAEEFLAISAKYLILCKKFKLPQMMATTQQILIESLNFFVKLFPEIDRYPKLIFLTKIVLDIERYFFKVNFQASYLHLLEQPDEDQIESHQKFVESLQVGDIVDALKSDSFYNRQSWSRAKIRKIGTNQINISYLNQRNSYEKSISKTSMEIFPLKHFTTDSFDWRLQINVGDFVDYQVSSTIWARYPVKEIKLITDDEGVIRMLGIQTVPNEIEWVTATSPNIQRVGTFSEQITEQELRIRKKHANYGFDDFNDILLARKEYKNIAICRNDHTKSLFYIYLTNYFHKIGAYDLILNKINNSDQVCSIDITVELITLVSITSPIFYRTFARTYLPQLCDSLVNNILRSPDSNIRNFAKQKIDATLKALDDFYKRYLPITHRKEKMQFIRLELAKLFIESGFLERKMNSLTIITELIKEAKSEELGISFTKLEEWIINHKIIQKLYHQTSHPELIARSSDLLKVYLSSNPSMKSLQPLLELNQAIVKLISQNLLYFPEEFIKLVASKVTTKNIPLNVYTLNIVKHVGGYEKWLLEKGGLGWVEVVKQKKNKREDIIELFKHPFSTVSRIFFEIIKIDFGFIQQFLKRAIQIDYITHVIEADIDINKKLEFCRPYFKYIDSIDAATLLKIQKLWKQVSVAPSSNKIFFETFKAILALLQPAQVLTFFANNFKKVEDIKSLTLGGFMVFKKIFDSINEKETHDHEIDEEISTNPLNMTGMNELINIIFESERLEVTKAALEYISHLFDKMSENYDIKAFRQGFLQKCLSRLYESSNYQKYLSILESILNESQKFGNGNLQPMSHQLPPQSCTFAIINHFSEVKNRFILSTQSNLTLYQLRHHIGKNVNAFGSQIKLENNETIVDQHLNALTIQESKLEGTLIVTKKNKIDRVELTHAGKLVDDAVNIFRIMFNQYSTDGLMSKADCKKLNKRIAGDSMLLLEHKVDKLFEAFDADKDGNLKFEEFLQYYENASRVRPSTVWNNLEAYGVREDLKVLGDIELTQPDPTTLTRYLLLQNKKFMGLLFKLLKEQKRVAECAWNLLFRLPIYTDAYEFLDKSNPYMLRYELYLMDNSEEINLNSQIIDAILQLDDQTLAIGLKVIEKSAIQITIAQFLKLFDRVEKFNSGDKVNFYNKLILEYSLKIITKAIQTQQSLQEEFLKNNLKFQNALLAGLMGKKLQLRNFYVSAVNDLFHSFINKRSEVFVLLFNMIYLNFEKCNKRELSPEYFELFSNALELIKTSVELFEKLSGKHLLRTIIKIFKDHQSTETTLNAHEDFIAIGFMKLISKMLVQEESEIAAELVEFLFKQCLFPQQGSGLHKLKNTKSRKQAYDLIYTICKLDVQNANALHLLFNSGFKKIYKSMAEVRSTYYFNEIRSQFGYAGIRNLGCVCYMISMIQQFFLTKPFRYLMLMTDDGTPQALTKCGSRQVDDNILHQFQNMFANLELTQKQEVNPEDFCFSFKDFEGNPVNVSVQQDAQQFLNMLFDKLQQGIKHTPFKHIIDEVYGGKYCNQFVCSSCKHVIERHQNFYNLSLEIKGIKNIDQSFKKFITGEVISDYKCDNCNKKTDTTKRCLVSKMPNYLILYLQRMCFNYDKFENEKVNTRWEFPHKLNLYDYTLQKEKKIPNSPDFDYELKGIVVHIGSAEFGHYFSYIKSDNGQWLEYNDERVREFDPKDIEEETFGGGTGWRKDHQSAYLLLYEKVHKEKLTLQFSSIQQKEKILTTYNLKQIKPQVIPAVVEQTELVKLESQQNIEQVKQKVVEKKQQKITAVIDLLEVNPYVPENLRQQISKANEEFSLHIHISSPQFMQFLYKISTIDPPSDLKNQFLQLCYECFAVKQHIGDSTLTLADQMPKRFNQLIKGAGWGFFETEGMNWNKEIFHHQRTSRTGSKKLIIAVLTDVISTYCESDQARDYQEKRVKIDAYLDTLLGLLREEVQDSWMRFQQYFEIWIELNRSSKYIQQYLKSKNMIEILLDFLLENNSPLKLIPNRHLMGSRYMSPSFDQPFELLFELIGDNHQFTDNQLKCTVNYAFLEKLVKIMPKKTNIIEALCRNNSLVSERMAYTIVSCLTKVTHSDDSKPLIETIHQYLNIKDDLSKLRIQWIIGLPQLQYHPKTASFGIYGLSTITQPVYTFVSPLSITPVLQITNIMREKYEHITILLMSMLLQLEVDGLIKLSDYPANLPLQWDYTYWFNGLVETYYEQMTKPHTGDNYKGYAKRAYSLWKDRAPQTPTRYIIGKTLEETQISRLEIAEGRVQLRQYQLKVPVVQSSFSENRILTVQKNFMHKSNPNYFTFEPHVIDSFKNSEYFFRKVSSYQSKPGDELKNPQENPFEDLKITHFIRKICLRNNSSQDILVLLKIVPISPVNALIPLSPMRIMLRPLKEHMIVLTKLNADVDWGQYQFDVNFYEQASSPKVDELPKQLITPYDGQEDLAIEVEDDYMYGYYTSY